MILGSLRAQEFKSLCIQRLLSHSFVFGNDEVISSILITSSKEKSAESFNFKGFADFLFVVSMFGI